MNNRADTLQCWALMPRELVLWAAAVVTFCLWTVLGHGAANAAAEVRIGAPGSARTVASTTPTAGRLDINRASAAELQMLPGIGRGRAAAIVRERSKRGAFRSIWELTEVKGLTRALVQRIEPLIQAGAPAGDAIPLSTNPTDSNETDRSPEN